MANIVYRDQFDVIKDSWSQDGSWITFDNKLVGVHHVRINLLDASTTISLRLTTPEDNLITFDKTTAHLSDYVEVAFPIKTQPNDNDKVVFSWSGGSQEVIIPMYYPFYELAISGTMEEFLVYKEEGEGYDTDFITGVGYHSLEPQVVNNSINVDPGYFYVNNQEYYFFNDMGVLDIDTEVPSGVMPSGAMYIPGSPYFVVPSGNIDETLDYIKTPSNIDYDVRWEEVDVSINPSGYIPYVSDSLTGYKLVYETSDDPRTIVPSGTGGLVLPILKDDSYLVLASGVMDPYVLEQYPIWLDYTNQDGEYEFYTYVEDEYGSPLEGATVNWHYFYVDTDDVSFYGDIGSAVTNNVGVVTGTYTVPLLDVKNLFIWATGSAFSNVRWVQAPPTAEDRSSSSFQLNNPGVRWDCQAARTALGHNAWGDQWGDNSAEDTGVAVTEWGASGPGGNSSHGDWETYNYHLERPPIHYEDLGRDIDGLPGRATLYALGEVKDETSGVYNIQDYMDDMAIAYPSGTLTYGGERWCTFDGFWGQFRIRGSEIQDPTNSVDCLNATEALYNTDRVDTFDNKQGLFYQEVPGCFDDVKNGGVGYANLWYVFYYDNADYLTRDHDDIRDEILDGTAAGNCHFRGMVIYPIALSDGSNVVDVNKQNWKIANIISEAKIIH